MYQNITFWLSIIAFCLSLYNFIESLINSIKHISINVYKITEYVFSDKYVYQALITISNSSTLSISVNHLVANDLNCKVYPSLVSISNRKTGNEIVSSEIIKTIHFPINLASLQSYNGYIEFISKGKIDKTKLTFDAYTNRGKISSISPLYIDCNDI